jgi:hypothetical protein
VLGRLARHPYLLAGVGVFVTIVVFCWTSYIDTHEMIYFLGSRRIADPSLLAADFTWGKLSPTSIVFDHLVAPLWRFFDEFTIANIGRFLFWGLMAWSAAFLGRTLRLPPWSLVIGFVLWFSWQQSFATCGLPFEGFQVKSLSYPLLLFALGFVMRGQALLAGAAAGLGTAFHIPIGGWACMAILLSMLVHRQLFPWRQVAFFLLATVPFVLPVVAAAALHHAGHVTPLEQARMDVIYVMFAMPHCCDINYFMIPIESIRVAVVFILSLVVVWGWREHRAARVMGGFLAAIVLFYVGSYVARQLHLFGVLKLYPFQLATSLPALFLFIFAPAWGIAGGAAKRYGRVAWALVIAGTAWLLYDRNAVSELTEIPGVFVREVFEESWGRPPLNDSAYVWIRTHTPENSVFITPFVPEFWSYAERAQVASIRHPPLDRRIIEWKERLEAINGFRRFKKRGFEIIPEFDAGESLLTVPDLVAIRERYGATHYLSHGERPELAAHRLYSWRRNFVYDLSGLDRNTVGGTGRDPDSSVAAGPPR